MCRTRIDGRLAPMGDAATLATLKQVGSVMVHARDPWWIIGSSAVALHGADPGHIADVDVLLSVDDAMAILPRIGVALIRGSGNASFRSDVFATWRDMAMPVEFMAGFNHRQDHDWCPVQMITREPIDFDGVALFVPSRAELLDLLERFGRPKDTERARALSGAGSA